MSDRSGHVKALLLAGGLGARLRPLTDKVPKCLVPIAGRPLLNVWVECLAEAGIVDGRIRCTSRLIVTCGGIDTRRCT